MVYRKERLSKPARTYMMTVPVGSAGVLFGAAPPKIN
jgi:hypothetical protein